MSKTLDADRLRVQLYDWFTANVAPNVGAGSAAPLGSWISEVDSSNPHLFLKTGAGSSDAVGWTRQNLTNMKVFNVRAFGATGDGITNDKAAIQSTINAAVAAGGGFIYFPKGHYAIYKPAGGLANVTSFNLSGLSNLVFIGDGYVSQLWQVGDSFHSDWHLFTCQGLANQIQFRNLYFDASRTSNPDPAGQQHTIRIFGAPADVANSGAFKIDVIGCFFDYQIGDHVNLGAGNGKPVHDNRVLYNAFSATSVGPIGGAKFRSAVGFQTNVLRTLVALNFARGCSDQTIDYEPTSNGGTNQGDNLVGNQADGQLHRSAVFSFAGVAHDDPIKDTAWCFNIGFNGGSMIADDASTSVIVGNVIVNQNDTDGTPVFSVLRSFSRMLVAGNVFVSTSTILDRQAIALQADNFDFPHDSVIAGNVCRTEQADVAAFFESCSGILFEGNICTNVGNDSINGASVVFSSNLYPVDLVTVRHNVAYSEAGSLARVPVKFSASTQAISNALAIGNYLRNSTPGGISSGIQWTVTSPGAFSRGHGSIDNLCVGGTTNSITYASINSMSCSASASGGAGAQVALANASAGPEGVLEAHTGSLCVNPAGPGDSAIVFYREAAPTSNTGWLRVGTTDVQFGCADTTTAAGDRFMAPSSDLAAAGVVEIQFRVWKACRIRNGRVQQTAGTGGGNITYTLRKNGADTGLAITIGFTTTAGNSGASSIVFAAGDLVSIRISKSAVPVSSPKNAVLSLEIT